jgi:hypothetical protein
LESGERQLFIIWKVVNGNSLLFGKRRTATFYYLESGERCGDSNHFEADVIISKKVAENNSYSMP